MKLSQIAGGGLFRLRSRVTGTIASGVTGTILTLTAPAGQIARLVLLGTSGGTTQSGISVVADGNTVLSGILSENDSGPSGDFLIADPYPLTTSVPLSTVQAVVKEVVGNTITVQKNAGNTAQSILYAVEYGVMQ